MFARVSGGQRARTPARTDVRGTASHASHSNLDAVAFTRVIPPKLYKHGGGVTAAALVAQARFRDVRYRSLRFAQLLRGLLIADGRRYDG